MLSPKRLKFHKQHKGRIHGLAKGGSELSFGSFGLKALTPDRVTARQIEAARVILSRYTKKIGKCYIRIFPYLGITKKPAEVRMGNGKGTVEYWDAVVEKGTVMFEIGGINPADARYALHQAGYKLSVKSRVVKKGEELK